jgi:hypothetical protein
MQAHQGFPDYLRTVVGIKHKAKNVEVRQDDVLLDHRAITDGFI